MMKSPTKSLRAKSIFFTIMSTLLNIAPALVFTIMAYASGEATVTKIGLSCTLLIILVLSGIAIINKVAMRSRLWILLIGLWLCLDTIMIPLIVIAGCQVADELIVCPLRQYYKTRYTINREFDKRAA